MQDSAWEAGAKEAKEAERSKPARTSETIPVPAPCNAQSLSSELLMWVEEEEEWIRWRT